MTKTAPKKRNDRQIVGDIALFEADDGIANKSENGDSDAIIRGYHPVAEMIGDNEIEQINRSNKQQNDEDHLKKQHDHLMFLYTESIFRVYG